MSSCFNLASTFIGLIELPPGVTIFQLPLRITMLPLLRRLTSCATVLQLPPSEIFGIMNAFTRHGSVPTTILRDIQYKKYLFVMRTAVFFIYYLAQHSPINCRRIVIKYRYSAYDQGRHYLIINEKELLRSGSEALGYLISAH